jgi:hypothetical protein
LGKFYILLDMEYTLGVFKMDEERINIKMVIENEELEKFKTVKKTLGLSANTEVIRALIAQKYQEIVEKSPKRVQK